MALGLQWGIVGAGMVGRQWEQEGELVVVVIMQNGCPGLPQQGLFLLSRATDEPQMDDQLLLVSGPLEVGSSEGRCVCVCV